MKIGDQSIANPECIARKDEDFRTARNLTQLMFVHPMEYRLEGRFTVGQRLIILVGFQFVNGKCLIALPQPPTKPVQAL